MSKFFSIIIPVYNSEKTLAATLNSLIAQTCKDFELILVNDCSTDKSINIIKQYKNKFIDIIIINNNANIGVANSRNKGIQASNGKYIAFLDSDDLWAYNKLEEQKKLIIKTNCDICCSSYSFIDESGNEIKRNYIIPEKITYKMLLKENYIGCSSVVVKRELLINNEMNNSYFHEDYALWLKLSRNNTIILGTKEVLIKYRIISNSRSFNKLNAAKNRFLIYRNQENMSIFKSLYYISHYTFNGIKKKLL